TSMITVNFKDSGNAAFAVSDAVITAVSSSALTGGGSVNSPFNALRVANASRGSLRVVSGDSGLDRTSISYNLKVFVTGHGQRLSDTITVPGNQTR
ncbi:MAG: hypothetical protein NTZ05_12865, partial [Chloroflexi bacterium]|nr:hypothetical protein [Chloroflexota bacterium]